MLSGSPKYSEGYYGLLCQTYTRKFEKNMCFNQIENKIFINIRKI